MSNRDQEAATSSAQTAWKELFDHAMKEPGVAEILELQKDAPTPFFGVGPLDPPESNYWVSSNWHA